MIQSSFVLCDTTLPPTSTTDQVGLAVREQSLIVLGHELWGLFVEGVADPDSRCSILMVAESSHVRG
jgi:hypothetical protein